MTPTRTARRAVAACLVVTAALSAVSSATAPAFPSGYAAQLAEFAEAGGRAWLSALAFVAAQLPFALAMAGLCLVLRTRTPRLAAGAAALLLLGAFGHAVFGGVSLTSLVLAADEANRTVHAAVLADVESSPIVAFAAAGLLGTVLGLVLLALALWRGHAGPRWVPIALAAFLVVEFAGSAVSAWSSQVAAVVYLVTFAALALHVLDVEDGDVPGADAGDGAGTARRAEPAR